MINRIDANSGQGFLTIIATPCVEGRKLAVYSESIDHPEDGLHARLGGECYYESLSGLSCAGWFPADSGVLAIPAYRADVGGCPGLSPAAP